MFKVEGFLGIGDTFYQRPFIKELVKKYRDIALYTAYPELHWDIEGLKYWFKWSTLRCQDKAAMEVSKSIWEPINKRTTGDLILGYQTREFEEGLNVIQSFEKLVTLTEPFNMDFPLKDEWIEKANNIIGNKRVCILRRPTVRREYNNPARNPQKGLMQLLINELKKEEMYIIAVGDLADIDEEPEEKYTGIDEIYEKGELKVWEIAALIKQAEITLTPVGFATPMAIAVNGRCFTVFGGHVPPKYIYDERMNLENHRYIAPIPFCKCLSPTHNCKKDIDNDYARNEIRSFIAVEQR